MVNYVYYLVCLCFGIFGVKYFAYVQLYVSCSFVFVLRVCERLTTHSLISFYCFEFLSLLEKLIVFFLVIEARLLLSSVSSFQRPTSLSDWLQYR